MLVNVNKVINACSIFEASKAENMRKHLDVILFILVLAIARLMMTIPNFEPIGAMALFGGAVIGSKRLGMIIPIAALFIGDIVHALFISSYMDYMFSLSFLMVYISFVLIVLIGRNWIGQKANMGKVLSGAVGASLLFFILTNFGSWLYDPMYAKNIGGLVQSYAAGLAFYKKDFFGNFFLNGLMANVFFSILVFGAYKVFQKNFSPSIATN